MSKPADFERLADAFFRESGIVAPGKDIPPELAKGDQRDEYWWRRKAFLAWLRTRIRGNSDSHRCPGGGPDN